jgi:AcrR family transcriptional regulator
MSVLRPVSRKENIRLTARRLFRERGYAATSMRDIAREVGLEAPSLYAHFRAKEELLHDICFDMAERFFSSFHQLTTPCLSPVEKLQAAVSAHIHTLYAHPEESVVFFHEWIFLSEPDLSAFKKMRSDYEALFRAILQEGIQHGCFRPVDVRLTAYTLLSSMNAVYDFSKLKQKVKVSDFQQHIFQLFVQGIKS